MTESVRSEDDSCILVVSQAAPESTGYADGEMIVWELRDLTSRGTVWPSCSVQAAVWTS